MTIVRLKIAVHGDAQWVEWDEREGDRRLSRGLVVGSRRIARRDAMTVFSDMRERLLAAGYDVHFEDCEAPTIVVKATSQQIENATGRVLRP